MRIIYLSFLILTANYCIAQSSFIEKLDKFNINLTLPVEQGSNSYRPQKDEFAHYDAVINPSTCQCEIRYIVQDEYVPGPFLPPHAEMIRLLSSLGSNGTNNILIEQYPENSGQWSAMAHFAPKFEITTYDYATMSTYYKTDGPLIHIVVFYSGEKEEILAYLDGNRY